MTQAVSAASFIDTLGINTHLDFGGSPYTTLPLATVEANISYLGVPTLRDSAGSTDLTLWQQVAQATGVKFDDYMPEGAPSWLQNALTVVPQLAAEGVLRYVEGGNEEDDPYAISNGNSLAWTAQFQQQVYSTAHSLGLPVINMSFGAGWTAANNWQGDYGAVGDLSAYTDYANAHTYPQPGQLPNDVIQRLNGLALLAASQRPVMTTEIGWDTTQFDQNTIAKYVLDATMDGIKDGDAAMWFYGLYDDQAGNWGLFNSDGTARPAATALHDLTTLLTDPNGANFTPGSLNYTLSGTQTGDNSTLIEKSDGTFWLALWNETEAANSPHTVTVNLGSTAGSVTEFDPLAGTSSLKSWSNVSSVQVAMLDHPILLEIGSVSSGGTTGGSSGSGSSGGGSSTGGSGGGTTSGGGSTGGTSSVPDPVISYPATDTVAAGTTTVIPGVSISDPWAATCPGLLALNVWTGGAGEASLGGQTGTSFQIDDTLANINADLANLKYIASSTAGTDTLTLDIWDQAGVESTQTINITIGSAGSTGGTTGGSTGGSTGGQQPPPPPPPPPPSNTVTLDPSNPNPVINDSNLQINGTGSFSLFIGGTHDVAILTGGTETVQAYQGYNTITLGAGNDSVYIAGNGNTIDAGGGKNYISDAGNNGTLVMPKVGGYDDIYGYIFQQGDTIDLRSTLAATSWKGTQADLTNYLKVAPSADYGSTELYARNTSTGSWSHIATFEGDGAMTLTQFLAHAIT